MLGTLRLTSKTLLQSAYIRPPAFAQPRHFVHPQPLSIGPRCQRTLFDHHRDPELVGQIRKIAADLASDESRLIALVSLSNLVFCDALKSGGENAIAMHREWRKSLQSMKELLEADAKSTEPKWTKDEREAALQALTITRLASALLSI